jgi:hypothetical protein
MQAATTYVLLLLFAPPTGGATSMSVEFTSHESCLTAGRALEASETPVGSRGPSPVKFVCIQK